MLFDKVFPHWGKEVDQNSLFKTYTAMIDTILLAEGISPGYFTFLISDGKAEASFCYVCDLGMGMAMQRSHSAGLKVIFHAHESITISQYLSDYSGRGRFSADIFIKDPLFVFVVFMNSSIPP